MKLRDAPQGLGSAWLGRSVGNSKWDKKNIPYLFMLEKFIAVGGGGGVSVVGNLNKWNHQICRSFSRQSWTARTMFEKADDFFQSMGLKPVPRK